MSKAEYMQKVDSMSEVEGQDGIIYKKSIKQKSL